MEGLTSIWRGKDALIMSTTVKHKSRTQSTFGPPHTLDCLQTHLTVPTTRYQSHLCCTMLLYTGKY